MSAIQYRPEVDGLRALAVGAIVLFHAGFSVFSGGFVGVDIFFVISGYLITSIILRELNGGTFGLWKFYERRVRRIIPALGVCLLGCLAIAPFVALPEQVIDIGNSAVAAIFSVSNIYFWRQSGYFSPAADFTPLLHTWSLGVEEQFYLIFPAIMYALHSLKFSIRTLLTVSLIPLFALSVFLSYRFPSAAFYLLPARAWELGLGAVLASGAIPAVGNRMVREAISALGVSMIVLSVVLLDSGVLFPGWAALLPCVGTALVIQFADRDTVAGRALSMRPVVFVGLISYSLYLWHWPVLAFSRLHGASIHLDTVQALLAILLAFGLAVLSWRFVERPFRDRVSMPGKRMATLLGGALAAIGVVAAVFIVGNGLPGRLDERAKRPLLAASDIDPLREPCLAFATGGRKAECRFGVDGQPVSFVMIGDSHAAALRPGLDRWAGASGRAGSLWWQVACPMLVGASRVPDQDNAECLAFKDRVLAALSASPDIDTVIIAGRWGNVLTGIAPEIGGSYRTYLVDADTAEHTATATERVFARSLGKTLDSIAAMGKRVIVVGGLPEPGFDVPRVLALAALNRGGSAPTFDSRNTQAANARVEATIGRIVAQRPGVEFIRIWDAFCAPGCALMRDGVPLYSDDDHITRSAAHDVIGPMLAERLARPRSAAQ